MAGEWKSITAEQFCAAVRDGTHDSPKPVEHGRFLVTSRHIISGRLDLGNAYLISQDDFDAINKRSKVGTCQWK
jgi:type I restriction enzyme S subunit